MQNRAVDQVLRQIKVKRFVAVSAEEIDREIRRDIRIISLLPLPQRNLLAILGVLILPEPAARGWIGDVLAEPQSPGESLTCRHFPAIPVTYPACCRIFAMEGSSLNEGRDAVWFDMPPCEIHIGRSSADSVMARKVASHSNGRNACPRRPGHRCLATDF